MSQVSVESAGSPPVLVAPGDGPIQPVSASASLLPVTAADLKQFPGAGAAKELERRRELLERRLGDARMLQALREADFAGPGYDMFERELVRYALDVMQGWLYSGHVFALCAKRGYPLKPSPEELTELRENRRLRACLSNATVGYTMPDFKERALRGGEWNVAGGAAIPTYLMGATLFHFPNRYREWQKGERNWRRSKLAAQPVRPGSGANPAAAMDALIDQRFPELTADQRTLVTMDALDCTYAEIAEALGISVRSVEGRLARLRKKYRERRPS